MYPRGCNLGDHFATGVICVATICQEPLGLAQTVVIRNKPLPSWPEYCPSISTTKVATTVLPYVRTFFSVTLADLNSVAPVLMFSIRSVLFSNCPRSFTELRSSAQI